MEKKEEKKKPSGSFSEVWDKRGQETDAANDFRKKIEMEITEARPGYAVGEIVLKPWHMNILGIAIPKIFICHGFNTISPTA